MQRKSIEIQLKGPLTFYLFQKTTDTARINKPRNSNENEEIWNENDI
jgi:hypothetical protein